MSDDDAFRKAIDAHPNDSSLKLIYADWLEDHGDPRAENLRKQAKEPIVDAPFARPSTFSSSTWRWIYVWAMFVNEAVILGLDHPRSIATEAGGRGAMAWDCALRFGIGFGVIGLLLGWAEGQRVRRYFRELVRFGGTAFLIGAFLGGVIGWFGWGFYVLLVWLYLRKVRLVPQQEAR